MMKEAEASLDEEFRTFMMGRRDFITDITTRKTTTTNTVTRRNRLLRGFLTFSIKERKWRWRF
jgi:hypothetical protein